nr:hypothetical protein [Haloplanus sp. XH21]
MLVGGGCLSFAFHATAGGATITYEATAVEPGENPERVTRATSNVTDLDERLSDTPSQYRQPIRTAAATGTYDGTLSPELHIVIEDIETPYVQYNGSYYAWTLSTYGETTNATISMQQTDPETVFTTVARPVAEASPEVQTAIETGTTTGPIAESGLYRQNGTYYVVAPENEDALGTQLMSVFVGFILTPVGRGYVAVGLGLLGYRYREPTRDQLLTVRRAVAIAALAIPIALVGTALFESGTPTRFVTGPASETIVASGVVAGVLTAQRRWLRLVGMTIGVGLLTTAAISAVLGPVGLFFGPLAVFLGFVTGVVPFGYGYWFAQTAPREPAQ